MMVISMKAMTSRISTNKMNEQTISVSIHPATIPSRFHTIHIHDAEVKGFNSTSKRFTGETNDLPGCGHYADAASKAEMLDRDKSLSKLGMGVGFASKDRRFQYKRADLMFVDVSPANYTPKIPVYSVYSQKSASPAFRAPILQSACDRGAPVRLSMVKTRWGSKPSPSPASYKSANIADQKGTRFGLAKRDVVDKAKDTPAPGSYETNHTGLQFTSESLGAVASFKTSARNPKKM